jgi:predicted anti-sigma-YlaC factor YlaD
MHILTPLTLVGLGVVLTRFVAACTLGVLASLLAFADMPTYRLLLCHLLLGLLGTSMQMHLP